jgi:hypothetical protein
MKVVDQYDLIGYSSTRNSKDSGAHDIGSCVINNDGRDNQSEVRRKAGYKAPMVSMHIRPSITEVVDRAFNSLMEPHEYLHLLAEGTTSAGCQRIRIGIVPEE